MTQITFTNIIGIPDEYGPKPATSSVPEWYKSLESYLGGEKKPAGDGGNTGTIKRCMPVFDAIINGYILYTYADVWVSQKDGKFWYEWPSFNPIEWHPVEQAPNHPNRNGHQESYPKWINPWAIQTPPGYSTLFVQPFHRESVFTILPGVVDTDQYNAAVNFPFVFNNINFEGLIPAGTPMAQVIPFKRESWEMSIGTQEDFEKQNKTTIRLRTRFFDSYKSQFRQPKEYK
jgi:hypothetical protein